MGLLCLYIAIPSNINIASESIITGVDSAPSENEYQEYFLGVEVAGA
jgi:hypothetical protein